MWIGRAIALSLGMLALLACGSADLPAAVAPTPQLIPATSAARPTLAPTVAGVTTQPAPAANAGSTAVPTGVRSAGQHPQPAQGSGESRASSSIPLAALTPSASAADREPARRPTSVNGPTIITQQDDGQTIELTVGAAIELQLSENMDWTVEVDERVLAPDTAAPGVYRAIAAGETQLLAQGSPKCAKATPPCAMPARVVMLRVIVR
jgi:hypothetical protein